MAVSFFTISIILYKTWSLFPPIIIRSIDTALLLCGMLGVLSLSNIQIIQKKNVLLSADTRFERPSKEFTAFIQNMKNFDGTVIYFNEFQINEKFVKKWKQYLSVFITLKSTQDIDTLESLIKDNPKFKTLYKNIDGKFEGFIKKYLESKKDYLTALHEYKIEVNRSDQYMLWTTIFFLIAIIIGMFKYIYEYFEKIANEANV